MSNTFAIGDIHGRLDLLEEALDHLYKEFPEGGKIVFLGDYIDRGPDSRGVLEKLIAGPPDNWEFICLKGNHDQFMEMYKDDNLAYSWMLNGGNTTIEQYVGNINRLAASGMTEMPEEFLDHVEWIKELPKYYEDEHRVYVHASVDTNLSLDDHSDRELLWDRYPDTHSGGYRGKYVVHGHTPQRDGSPSVFHNRINIDTGAYSTGRLCCIMFDDDKAGPPSAAWVTGG